MHERTKRIITNARYDVRKMTLCKDCAHA